MLIFRQLPGQLDLHAVAGDDFYLDLDFDIDLTDVDLEATVQIYEGDDPVEFTVNDIELDEGKIQLHLAAEDTAELNGKFPWRLIQTSPHVRTWLAGVLQIFPPFMHRYGV